MVAGCLVQRYGPELVQDLPEVDLFIGVNDFPALPRLWPGRRRTAPPPVSSGPALRLRRGRGSLPRHARPIWPI